MGRVVEAKRYQFRCFPASVASDSTECLTPQIKKSHDRVLTNRDAIRRTNGKMHARFMQFELTIRFTSDRGRNVHAHKLATLSVCVSISLLYAQYSSQVLSQVQPCGYAVIPNPVSPCQVTSALVRCPGCDVTSRGHDYTEYSGNATTSLGPGNNSVTSSDIDCDRAVKCIHWTPRIDYKCEFQVPLINKICKFLSPQNGMSCQEWVSVPQPCQQVTTYSIGICNPPG